MLVVLMKYFIGTENFEMRVKSFYPTEEINNID